MLRALSDRVLVAERIVAPPIVLQEEGHGSRCAATAVENRGTHFAVRLRANDHLRILRGRPGAEDGFCNLPDYLIFSEAQLRNKKVALRVLLVEMKSSDAGRPLALRQIQLGVPLASYLAALARLDDSKLVNMEIHQAGLILSPELPEARPRTRRGEFGYEPELDPKAEIYIYDAPCGEPFHLDAFSYCLARV